MSDTIEPVRKSRDASTLAKLCRMLRSMSRRFPKVYLQTTLDGFGVRLADGSYLRIVYSGKWTDEDIRDFLALFATWLVADPDRLHNTGIPLDGVSATVSARLQQSSTQPNSRLAPTGVSTHA